MLDQLQYKSSVITLESNSGPMGLAHAVNRLPDFFLAAKQAYNTYLAQPLSNLFSKNDIQTIANQVRGKNYVALRSLEMYAPPGLKVDYLTYAQVLQASTKEMLSLRTDVLQPFNTWLGQKLGNPSSLASITTNLNIPGFSPHPTEKLEKDIQACFNNTGRQEVLVTYGDVIRRNADWDALGRLVDELSTAFSEAHHKDLSDLVNQTTGMMDLLMKRMQEEPEAYRISQTALQALSTTCFIVGRELEFYGMLRQRIGEFSTAVNDSAAKLAQI